MRFLRILALSAVALGFTSCADDDGGPIANPDISWFVGCAAGSTGCGSLPFHDQMLYPKPRYKVSCQKVGGVIEFTISDPGADNDPNTPLDDTRPAGSITVANGDSATNRCNVTVREYPTRGAASPLAFVGTCKGGDPMGACTLTGAFNSGGYVWAGTLSCDGLIRMNATDQARFTLAAAAAGGGPVKIGVDNCE